MSGCFKCGVSGDRALLFGAVSEKGIVKVCRKCSFEENIPIVKYIKEKTEKRLTVHERLSRLSGVERKNGKEKINKQNESLKKIVDENFKKNVLEEKPLGMVDNFHWIIMRARRSKKLTQKQFAEMIEESEEAIKMAEKGILPKNDFVLVKKIENYLGIRIKDELMRERSFDKEVALPGVPQNLWGKKVKEEFVQNVEVDKIKFDEITTKTLTIADLKQMRDLHSPKPTQSFDRQEMKKKRESAPQAYPETFSAKMFTKGKIFEKPDKIDLDKEDLSQEDIDRIIFGK